MGGVELFTSYAKLILEKAGFDRGAAEADKTGKSLADNLSGYMEKAKKVIAGLFSVVAIKKGAEAVWNLAKDTAAAGDKIDKQSQALGMSRKAYQEWAYILSQSGASIDDMGMSMKTMTDAIMENSAETAAGLSKLGLSAAQLQSMSPEEQFETLVKAFQQMPAGAEKSQLAIKLFGRNAQQLMPLLNSSADSVDELRKRAQELGLIMDDDAVDASVAFGDALDDLTATWDALKMKFGAQMLPGFTKGLIEAANSLGRISTALTGAFKTGDFATFFRVLTDEVSRLVPGVVDTTISIVQGLFSNADKVIGIAVSIVSGIATGIVNSLPILEDKLPEIAQTIWDALKDPVEGLANDIIATINNVFGTNIPEIDFSKVTEGLALVVEKWDLIKPLMGKVWKTQFKWAETGWEVVKTAFDGAAKWADKTFKVTVHWMETGWTVVSAAFTKAGEWVGEVWNTTVNWIKTGWDTIGGAFIIADQWVGGVWDTTINWVNDTWAAVSAAFTAADEWIGETWDITINWVNDTWAAVSEALAAAGKWVGETWDTTINWINDTWAAVSNAFVAATGWVDKTKDITVNWINDTWNAVSEAFTAADEWVGETWDVTVNWVNDTWDNVSSAFTTAAAWVGDTAHNISLAWKSTVDSWFTTIKKWLDGTGLSEIVADFGATVDGWFNTIKSWLDGSGWKDLTLNIGAIVSEWIERIYDWVTNGIDIVARFFGGGGSGSTGNGHSVGESYENQAGAWSFYNMTGQAPAGLHLNDAGTEWLHNAKGLNYVPYDGYKAILHRGETVLNQAQGREWRQGDGGINMQALYSAVAAAVASAVSGIQINMDGAAVGNAVTQQVSQNIYQAQLGRRYSTAW